MITDRQRKIIKSLSTYDYTSSSEIAKKLSVSDKTVRNEIKLLYDITPSIGLEIISKPKYGYKLLIVDVELAEEFYNYEMSNINENNRAYKIIEYMLSIDDYVRVDDLCDLLYLSQSSISIDLKNVRNILKKYRLNLITKPHYGMKIEGKEFDIRACISACNLNKEVSKRIFFNSEDIDRIKNILNTVFYDHDFKFNQFSFESLVVHLAITLERIRNKSEIKMPLDKLKEMQALTVYEIAKEIGNKIENEFDLMIPEEECGYIAIHLYGKQSLKYKDEDNFIVDEEIYELVDKMITAIDDEMNYRLSVDLDIRLGLAMHLIPLVKRLQHHLNLRNPLLEGIKDNYMLAYMMAEIACTVLSEKYQREVSEDEIGYVALYFNLALSRKNEEIVKKNIVIVCSTGRGSAELLAYQYKTRFGKYIQTLVTCDAFDIDKIDFSNIDYVFSTIDIQQKLPVPIIRIQYFLQNEDNEKITNMLNVNSTNSTMKYFSKKLFIDHLNVATRNEAIRKISKIIREYYHVPKNFEEMVEMRENKFSTDFGNMVAMPHPYRVCTNDTIIAVAILDNPILWDKKKVQVIFFISISKRKDINVQSLYIVLSKIMSNKNLIKQLIRKRDYNVLENYIKNIVTE